MEKDNINSAKDTFLAQWLAGELSDLELKKIVSDTDYTAYLKIRSGIKAYDIIEKPLDESFKVIEAQTTKQAGKVIGLHWLYAVAAAVLLFFGINYGFKTNTVEFQTKIGEQKTIALLDGSEVILNATTAISYNKKTFQKQRNVLLKGEAFFKVKKRLTPFTVKTSNGDVQVLGTSFSVSSYGSFFRVHCYSGTVKVIQNNVSTVLHANEMYQKMNSVNANVSTADNLIPYWLKGETHFASTPVKYVFGALERHYQLKINSKNIDKEALFTGTFPNNNRTIALKIVADAMQLKYSLKNNILILEKR